MSVHVSYYKSLKIQQPKTGVSLIHIQLSPLTDWVLSGPRKVQQRTRLLAKSLRASFATSICHTAVWLVDKSP